MNSVVMVPESRAATRASQSTAVPFGRLLRAEWRKQVDTRAGRWLLISIGIVTAIVITVQALVGTEDLTFEMLTSVTSSPLVVLIPVVGILAATQEWTQRTGLVTFVLEPRRTRVGLAKLVAALLTGVATIVLAVVLSVATYGLLIVVRDIEPQWSVDSAIAWGFTLSILLSMVQGVAFGLLFQNTPAAIVTFFVAPVVFVYGGGIAVLADVWPWIDLATASMPLLSGDVSGQQWAQLGTATTLWVVLPLVAGLIRLQRSEIKSA